MNAARATPEKNAAENAFSKKVWGSRRAFAEIAVPFRAGAQSSNANLGRAFARSLKMQCMGIQAPGLALITLSPGLALWPPRLIYGE